VCVCASMWAMLRTSDTFVPPSFASDLLLPSVVFCLPQTSSSAASPPQFQFRRLCSQLLSHMFVCLPGVRHVTPPLTLPPYRTAIRLLSYDFASLEENLLYRSETNAKGGARKRSQFNLNFHISSSPRQRLSLSPFYLSLFL